MSAPVLPFAQTPRRAHAGTSQVHRFAITACAGVAVTAIAGAIGLVAVPGFAPIELVAHSPFDSFEVPALLLACVGAIHAIAVVALWRRWRYALDLLLVAAGALAVWMIVEIALLRTFAALQAIYLALALALVVVAVRAAWRSGRARLRWIVGVTAGEAIGYLAPAVIGIAVQRVAIDDATRALAIAAAGLVEGFALGVGQALVLPVRVRRLRYALLTSLGAGLVWASVMATMQLGASASPLAIPLLVATPVVGLVAIGGLQWLELRRHADRAWRWIGWTALAWMLALPASFAPGPFVDETTPLAVHLVLWPTGGLVMAYVMAVVTWQGARRLPHRDAIALG